MIKIVLVILIIDTVLHHSIAFALENKTIKQHMKIKHTILGATGTIAFRNLSVRRIVFFNDNTFFSFFYFLAVAQLYEINWDAV